MARIVRFYAGDHERETIETGVTLAHAREHCNGPEASSKTATSPEAHARTERMGPWFDGFYADGDESEGE